MSVLQSKLYYLIILILIIGIVLVILKLNSGKKIESPIIKNEKVSINYLVPGNMYNIGCLSVYINDKEDNHEYSFDNGNNWQKSRYGAIYGKTTILVKDQNGNLVYRKIIEDTRIVKDAPVIKINFDGVINKKSDEGLLKDVEASLNSENLLSMVKPNIMEDNGTKLLVSYSLEYNDKKCYLVRETKYEEIKEEPKEEIKDKWVWPTKRPYKITRGVSSSHNGLDIYGPQRGTSIYAAHDGDVVEISSNSSSGYYVTIKLDNGYYTRYAHLQNTNGNDTLGKTNSANKYIKVGQRVQAGDVIGEIGGSGNSTAVHLHFEVWTGVPFKSNVLNPSSFYK